MRPHPGPAPALPLAAILAGGASRRFGAPKALAEVGGVRLIERVRDALLPVVPDPVLITAAPGLYAFLGLPSRPDLLPGGGPLAGIHAALLWSAERERHGALVVACDLPFLSPDLLRRIVRRAAEGSAPAVAPEGPGPYGVEPLCAWYSVDLAPEVEARLEAGARSPGRLLVDAGAERIGQREVGAYGCPGVLFHNVNTRDDQLRAERVARAAEAPDGDP